MSPVKTKDNWRTGKHKYSELFSVFKKYLNRRTYFVLIGLTVAKSKIFALIFYAFSIFPEITNDFPRKQV
jgi:hypothetical protein